MSTLSRKKGLLVYGWLLGLTLFEVWLVYLDFPKMAGAILLGATTLAKSILIILYFMHMKYEKGIVWMLPAIPVVLAVIFVLALFPDIVYQLTLRW